MEFYLIRRVSKIKNNNNKTVFTIFTTVSLKKKQLDFETSAENIVFIEIGERKMCEKSRVLSKCTLLNR